MIFSCKKKQIVLYKHWKSSDICIMKENQSNIMQRRRSLGKTINKTIKNHCTNCIQLFIYWLFAATSLWRTAPRLKVPMTDTWHTWPPDTAGATTCCCGLRYTAGKHDTWHLVATEYSADVTCILVTEMRIFSDFKAGCRKIGLLLLFHIGLGHLSQCSTRINVKYYCKQIIQRTIQWYNSSSADNQK